MAGTQIYLDPKFSLGLLLGSGTPAEGDNVFEKLQEARNIIMELLTRFE